MDITQASRQQAKQFLELADNDLNTAVLLYFEGNNDQQQPAQQQPEKPKKSFFKKQPTKQNETQQITSQQNSNFHQFKPQDTAREQMVNGGESVALYRPKKEQKVQLSLYQNGFVLNDKFFSYEDPVNVKYRDDIMKSKQMPQELLQQVGIEATNSKDLDAQVIDNSQMTYQKAVENNQEKEQLPEFQGEGIIMQGQSKPFNNDGTTVNINLQHSDTRIKIKGDKNYVIQCNQKHKLRDLIGYLIKQNGLNQIPMQRIQAQTPLGQQINMDYTIGKSQLQGKVINLFYIE